MTPARLGRYRTSLEEHLAREHDTGPSRIEPNRKDPTSVGVSDEDEQALSEMLQTLSSQRNRKRDELLGQIHRALRKVADRPDDFGLCEDCEETIPEKRLDLVPWAALCAECQSKRDPRRGVSRKSLTDYK